MPAAEALCSLLGASAKWAVDVQWNRWDAHGDPILRAESSCTAAHGAYKSDGGSCDSACRGDGKAGGDSDGDGGEVGKDCSDPKAGGESVKCVNCVTRLHFTNRAAADLEFPSVLATGTPRSVGRDSEGLADKKRHQPEGTRVRKCAAYTHVAWLSYDEQKPLSAKLLKVQTRLSVLEHAHNCRTPLHARDHLLRVLFVTRIAINGAISEHCSNHSGRHRTKLLPSWQGCVLTTLAPTALGRCNMF